MSDAGSLKGDIDRIRDLFRQKYRARGASLAAAYPRARRRLPRRLRRDAEALVSAERFADHPKLARTLDHDRLGQAVQALRGHLDGIDLADRRKGMLLGILGSIAFNFLLVAALVIGWMVWQGQL